MRYEKKKLEFVESLKEIYDDEGQCRKNRLLVLYLLTIYDIEVFTQAYFEINDGIILPNASELEKISYRKHIFDMISHTLYWYRIKYGEITS